MKKESPICPTCDGSFFVDDGGVQTLCPTCGDKPNPNRWRNREISRTSMPGLPAIKIRHLVEVMELETFGQVADAIEAGTIDLGAHNEKLRSIIEDAKKLQPTKAEIDKTIEELKGEIGKMPEDNPVKKTRATRKVKDQPKSVFALMVSYGNLSVGDLTARLGITVARENISIDDADITLCGKRLTGKIMARPPGTRADQNTMFDSDISVDGTFDVKSFSVNAKRIGFSLTFVLASIDIKTLTQFAKREGVIEIETVEELPDDHDHDDEDN